MLGNQSIVNISSEEQFNSEVLKSTEPVIVDFYADWCGPCKKLGPLLEKAVVDNKSFRLAKVNVDNNHELSEEYKVKGIPHVVLIHEGKKVMEFSGLDANSLNEMIEKTKTLTKKKAFSGTGVVLDSNAQNADESLPDEIFDDFLKSLPEEPQESSENVYNIILKLNDLSFQRRFSGNHQIKDIKLFAKCKVKTLRDVELYETFPRKVYSDEEMSVQKSGLSKNQILLVKLI